MKMTDHMKVITAVQDLGEIFRLGQSDRFVLVAKSLVAIHVVNAKLRYFKSLGEGLMLVRC